MDIKSSEPSRQSGQVKNSRIVISNRAEINLSGISKVNSATEGLVSVIIGGENCNFEGTNLHIRKLDVESGFVEIEGKINTVKFARAKSGKSFFKRIFS